MSENAIEVNGVVVELLSNGFYKAKIENTEYHVTAYVRGKMRMNNIRILLGDKVSIKISPYDVTQGRIIYRFKKNKD